MKKCTMFCAIAALVVAVACKSTGNGSSSSQPNKPSGGTEEPSPLPKRLASDAELDALVAGNNSFAVELYKALRGQTDNLAFSPASVSAALAMTYAGARTETEAEMKATLRFALEQDRLHSAYADLTRGLLRGPGSANYDLAIANRLWGDKASVFLPAYLKLTAELYDAELEQLDFRSNPEAGRKTINAWVEEQTRDRIVELLKPGIIADDTRLVLTNAIYFKGRWTDEFDKANTSEETFFTADGEKRVQMMHQVEDLRAVRGDGLQALELSYQGDELAMVFILPDAKDGLPALEDKLTAELIEKVIGEMREQKVVVALPRYEVTSDFGLHEVLPGMGMKAAFTMAADFSGMNGAKDLYITAVVHKAFVKVDEEGSEAAAATAVVAGEKSAMKQPMRFIADHPFLFLIRDKRTGSILFLGRVVAP